MQNYPPKQQIKMAFVKRDFVDLAIGCRILNITTAAVQISTISRTLERNVTLESFCCYPGPSQAVCLIEHFMMACS